MNVLKIAVLIDADNSSATILEGLLEEVSKYGTISIKRIYGDWTSHRLSSWKAMLLDHAIRPIQQFAYTTGKNATDSAMIIDAMDILYNNDMDGFCLVSSDSDFTGLAHRLRESGKYVIGVGEQKTPQAFISACDKFVYAEILRKQPPQRAKEGMKKVVADKEKSGPVVAIRPMSKKELRADTKLNNLLRNAIEDLADDLGWAELGAVGNLMIKNAPEFDSRNYGYSKLSELIRVSDLYDTENRAREGMPPSLYVKDKRKTNK